MFVLQFFVNFFMGPTAALVFSMYTDAADYAECKTGRRSTGLVMSSRRESNLRNRDRQNADFAHSQVVKLIDAGIFRHACFRISFWCARPECRTQCYATYLVEEL